MSDDDLATSPAPSMIDKPGESGSARPTAGERAHEMRASLGMRNHAEAMLAAASQVRQQAAADAERIVGEAESLAAELAGEARDAAQVLLAESQERADGIVARARAEADELSRSLEAERERVRAEVRAEAEAEVARLRTLATSLVERAEAGLRELPGVLETATSSVAAALDAVDAFHQGLPPEPTDEDAGPADLETDVLGPQVVAVEVADGAVDGAVDEPAPGGQPDESEDPVRREQPAVPVGAGRGPASSSQDEGDARPLGWLFRPSQG